MNDSTRSILFLEKVFLRPPSLPLRGVELFNFRLIEDFLKLGFTISLPAHTEWKGEIEAREFGGRLTPVWTSAGELAGAPGLASHFARDSMTFLFLANVGNGLIPLLQLLRWRRVARKLVLLAHREASPRFVRALRRWPSSVICVNEKIAEPFREAGYPQVAVDYGIMDGDRFFPAEKHESERVRFVVLGALDNAWKGGDTAIEAFRCLPDALAARCELHLASYMRPPSDLPANVIAHPWMPLGEIPEFLRGMDVMLCPSRDEVVMRETFSQAIVQGMLTGLPILASELQIFVEKLDAGGGRIVRKPEEWLAQMAALASDSALRARLGAEGRVTALSRYCWDTARFVARHMDTASA